MLSTSRGSGLGNGKSNGDGNSESRASASASASASGPGPGSWREWRAEIGRRIGAAQAMATARRRTRRSDSLCGLTTVKKE
ncbi:hypothetical protein GB937_003717 [Aspergillus fischeri]|nr:hypothetical protein GB937_003717 [Aspergillus fischeri]